MIEPDIKRVKKAMKMVWKHKVQATFTLSDRIWNNLAEAATKTMWLIEEENRTKGRSIMTFKARFLAENPNKIEFTMKITMTAEEWERLRDAMDKAPKVYELNQLRYAVCDVLAQARKIFWAQEEKTESTVQEP